MITEDRVSNWAIAGLAFAAIMALSWSAKAEEQQPRPCGPYKTLQRVLAGENFHEKVLGVVNENQSFTIFSNPENHWVMWEIHPDGNACFLGSGDGFFSIGTGRNI